MEIGSVVLQQHIFFLKKNPYVYLDSVFLRFILIIFVYVHVNVYLYENMGGRLQ